MLWFVLQTVLLLSQIPMHTETFQVLAWLTQSIKQEAWSQGLQTASWLFTAHLPCPPDCSVSQKGGVQASVTFVSLGLGSLLGSFW